MNTKTDHFQKYLDPNMEIPALETPFKHIALAVSGGGYRAAAYGLGTFSYLQHVPYQKNDTKTLLENVTYISSASGGTITSTLYALHVSQGKSFNQFYTKLFGELNDTLLVKRALEILNSASPWKNQQGKSRNIINSFALAYNELLFESTLVKDLKANPESHIDEVCFNSTELYNGLLFRQAIKMKEDSGTGDQEQFLYGNFNLNLQHETAEKLYLSDLLAASSCFPGGFEPLVFPRDFTSKNTSKRDLLDGLKVELDEIKWDELYKIYGEYAVTTLYASMPQPVNATAFIAQVIQLPIQDSFKFCLMDGGITDNQGVESMVQANRRRVANCSDFKPFDLMLVCDVDSHYIPAYQLPEQSSSKWPTIKGLKTLLFITFLLGAAGSAFIGFFTCAKTFTEGVLLLLSFIVAAVSGLTFLYINKLKKKIEGQVNGSGINLDEIFSEKIRTLLFHFFGRLPFSKLKFLITVRLTSLIMLSSNVFMSRIRYLLYDQLFNQGNLKRTGRVKANHIYDLSFSNDKNRFGRYTNKLVPSPDMQTIAEYSMHMPTTLWFSKDGSTKKMQAAIIACGQFTTCFNLLDYIEKLKKSFDKKPCIYSTLSEDQKKIVDEMQVLLEKDFLLFQTNPFWLYNKLGKDYKINAFIPVDMSSYKFPEQFNGLRPIHFQSDTTE